MTRLFAIFALALPLAAALWSQPGAARKPLTFDAASVKPASIPSGVTLMEDGRIAAGRGSSAEIPPNTGGPGTDDPGRIHWPLISLRQLLRRAWDSYYAIDGPRWLDSQAVAIDATMPPDTTRAQFQEMLRNLIAERFGLQYHAGKKEIAGYTLSIAKNGPKLNESADQRDADWSRSKPPTRMGKDGLPEFPPVAGKIMVSSQTGDRSRIIAQQVTIQELAKHLASALKTIVTDATGLTAKYDFTLTFASLEPAPQPAHMPEGLEPLSDLFAALQSQLGLRLDRKPVPVDVFVIDRMERIPIGN